jgi:hypothetical protein
VNLRLKQAPRRQTLMATEKQIHANRNNAKKSTGPCTEQGKSRVN